MTNLYLLKIIEFYVYKCLPLCVIFFVYGCFTCIYVCMSGASGGSGAPGIGVRVVVNHQVDDGS